jgi:hypothetical protein
VGFYGSLVVFDHHLGKTFVVATGLSADGSRTEIQANAELKFWQSLLAGPPPPLEGRESDHKFSPPTVPEPPLRRSQTFHAPSLLLPLSGRSVISRREIFTRSIFRDG